MNKQPLSERIRQVRKDAGLTMEAFAQNIGVSKGTVSLWESGKTVPPQTTTSLIAKLFNLNSAWFLSGEGEKEIALYSDEGRIPIAREDIKEWDALAYKTFAPPGGKPEELLFINVFPLELAADPHNETYRRIVQSLHLPYEFSEKAPLGLKVRDNSMAPTIKEGAIVGLAFKGREIKDGEIYVLRTSGRHAMVRRVFLGINKYILKTDNPSSPAIEAPTGSIAIVGRVMWVLQT